LKTFARKDKFHELLRHENKLYLTRWCH